MVFQENALFDSLTVAENVGFGLADRADVTADELRQRVDEVLGFIGIAGTVDGRVPSGTLRWPAPAGRHRQGDGARRHVSFVRRDSITGLDPVIAMAVDAEMRRAYAMSEHVTSLVATHQIRDAFYVARHQAVRDGDEVVLAPADAATSALAEFMLLRDGRVHFLRQRRRDPGLHRSLRSRGYLLNTLPPW